MCGITGIVYFEDREPSIAALQAMTETIVHRGPNDSGFWTDSHVG
jgi:asparagine synthase (glutamine-hydrolysing)